MKITTILKRNVHKKKKLKCQKLCSRKNMCVMHHPFSKSGHFFAISMKWVTISVPISKFTLFSGIRTQEERIMVHVSGL